MNTFLYDTAKKSLPQKLELIKTRNNGLNVFSVIAQKQATINELSHEEILLIEVHPIMSVKTFKFAALKPQIEMLNGTPYCEVVFNRFALCVDIRRRKSYLCPADSIALAPLVIRGCGIGSYMLSLLIRWGKENFADYPVSSGSLSAHDASDPENKIRRNSLYQNAGFELVPPDADDGVFKAESLGSLKEHWNPDKVMKVDYPFVLTKTYPFFDVKEIYSNLSELNRASTG